MSLQSFGDKKSSESRNRTYVLPDDMRADGITISAATVTSDTYEWSDVDDDTNIVSGDPIINEAATIDDIAIGASQSVTIALAGGIDECTYAVTFALTLSNGESFSADVLQKVTKYVG